MNVWMLTMVDAATGYSDYRLPNGMKPAAFPYISQADREAVLRDAYSVGFQRGQRLRRSEAEIKAEALREAAAEYAPGASGETVQRVRAWLEKRAEFEQARSDSQEKP